MKRHAQCTPFAGPGSKYIFSATPDCPFFRFDTAFQTLPISFKNQRCLYKDHQTGNVWSFAHTFGVTRVLFFRSYDVAHDFFEFSHVPTPRKRKGIHFTILF